MKVFFPISFFFPAQTGGPANSIYWLSKALKKKKVDVTVVTMDYDIPNEIHRNKWLNKNYGKVIYIKTWYPQFAFTYVCVSTVTAFNAQIIHLTSIFSPASFIIGICCSLFQKKMVWSVRGEFDTYALNYNRRVKKYAIYCLKLLNKINSITYHSTCEAETNYIRQVLGKHTPIIEVPNYMELPEMIINENQVKLPYFLYVGRHHAKKGLDNLILGVAKSTKFINSPYLLLIAGRETSYTNSLKVLIDELKLSKKIKFMGEVLGKEKEELYANAFFTIFPSHTENFGNIVVESLAQGTPVIASKGTPWAILEEFKAGFWINNEPESIKRYIEHVIVLTGDLYLMMRKNARKLSEEKFDITKNVDVWIKHYENILTQGIWKNTI